jgi:hypothetical protein
MSSPKEEFIRSLNQQQAGQAAAADAALHFQSAVEQLGHQIHKWLEGVPGELQVRTTPITVVDSAGHIQSVTHTLIWNGKHVTFEPKHIRVMGAAGLVTVRGLRYEADLALTPGGEWWLNSKVLGAGQPPERKPLDEAAFFALLKAAR